MDVGHSEITATPPHPVTGPKLEFAGSILSWVFYGPFMVAALVAPFSMWLEIKTFITFGDHVPLMGMLLGPVLLIACTTHSILSFRRSKEPRIRPQPTGKSGC
jgi:hypothetical protein